MSAITNIIRKEVAFLISQSLLVAKISSFYEQEEVQDILNSTAMNDALITLSVNVKYPDLYSPEEMIQEAVKSGVQAARGSLNFYLS